MLSRISLFCAFLSAAGLAWAAAPFSVDMRGLLSQQDVIYRAPARQGWEGLPLGNGTLGVQAWQPDGLKFQLNTALGGVYDGALCQVTIRPASSMLSGLKTYRQRLSLYNATLTTECMTDSGAVTSNAFIAATDDALIVELTDNRTGGKECALDLETWRPTAKRSVEGNVLLITDTLRMQHAPDYRFAVAAAVEGAPAGAATVDTSILTQQANGKHLVFWVAVAATRDPNVDVVAGAKARLAALRARGLNALRRTHDDWWARCWAKSYLKVSSDDATGDYLTNLWYMHIYAMAAGSRGEVPPKFNGGLWLYNRDEREWGSGYWHWNTQETYWPLYAANHLELIRPYYDMYWAMLPAVKAQTKDYFGVDGAHYEETIMFNGEYASGKGPKITGDHPRLPTPKNYGNTNMILSSSAEIAMQFWWYYLYTGDRTFLRDRAYPLMKEVATFYVNYLEKDANGVYQDYPSNAHETFLKVHNPATDLAAMRYLFPALIAASTRLDVDAELRAVWQDRLEHLAPFATNPLTGAILPFAPQPNEKVASSNAENPDLFPIGVFPLITQDTPDLKTGIATFFARSNVNVYGWTTDSIAAARLGLAEAALPNPPAAEQGLQQLLPLHVEYYQDHPSGLQDYYGRRPAIHPYLEGSGTFATGMNEMLLQSWNGIIRVCPALPKAWSADFKLLAMGGFEVTAHAVKGKVTALTLYSQRGEPASVVNPFAKTARVTCDGKRVLQSDQPLLNFPTRAGKTYLLLPTGAPAPAYTVTGTRNNEPKHLSPTSQRWIGLQENNRRWVPPLEPNAPQPPAVPAAVERPANPEMPATFVTTPPVINGDLNDPAWAAVKPLGPFFLLGKRTPATQQTEMRVAYDKITLYLACTCWETRMSGQIAETIPGATLPSTIFTDDAVEVYLHTGPGSLWHLAVNPRGAKYAVLGTDTAEEDTTTPLDWHVAVKRLSNRWSVAMAIPFAGLVPDLPDAATVWGVNFCRDERPVGETSTWAPLSQRMFYLPGEFGQLRMSGLPAAIPAMVTDPSLIAHWPCDALSGVWVHDVSGYRHAGLLTAAANLVDGHMGKALEFSGAGYINISPTADLDLTRAFTLTLWVNPKTKGAMRLIDKSLPGHNDAYMIDTYPENNLRVITAAGALNLPETLPVGQWTHVAVTFGDGKLRAYLNGRLAAETPTAAATTTTTLPVRLGADNSGGSRFVGLLKDVRIYNRPLSAEEVSALAAGQ